MIKNDIIIFLIKNHVEEDSSLLIIIEINIYISYLRDNIYYRRH
jgi:hypothetical protein